MTPYAEQMEESDMLTDARIHRHPLVRNHEQDWWGDGPSRTLWYSTIANLEPQ